MEAASVNWTGSSMHVAGWHCWFDLDSQQEDIATQIWRTSVATQPHSQRLNHQHCPHYPNWRANLQNSSSSSPARLRHLRGSLDCQIPAQWWRNLLSLSLSCTKPLPLHRPQGELLHLRIESPDHCLPSLFVFLIRYASIAETNICKFLQ